MPFKTISDKRLSYLTNLALVYQDMGYTTKINGSENLLEIYQKGTKPTKTQEEVVIEKWID